MIALQERLHQTETQGFRPSPARQGDDAFAGLGADLGVRCGTWAEAHDRDNSFVHENYTLFRESGFLGLAVPEELGGLGATMRQVCYAQVELARRCGSSALAVNMHHYLVLANTYRRRHGFAPAEGLLRRIAKDGAVVFTSGGSDGIFPSATAEKVEGGYIVNGRKIFCSQAPAGNVFVTTAVYRETGSEPVILMMSVPMTASGVTIIETWNAMGMRGTGSHDVELKDVFVGDAQISAVRPYGKVDPVLRAALVHFCPTMSSVYWGIAAGARDEALRLLAGRKSASGRAIDDPAVQRQIGLMDSLLRTSWWTLLGALDELGDDYVPDESAVGIVTTAKRRVIADANEVVGIAMEVVGGQSYYSSSPLQRAYRDVRAGTYHPLPAEKALLWAGKLAIGESPEAVW